MHDLPPHILAGQAAGLITLAICIAAFSSRSDARLMWLLLVANFGFVTQYVLFGSWVAAGISALVILRIVLAQRLGRSWTAMSAMLLATFAVAALTWAGPVDLLPLAAGVFGTVGMFLAKGIALRLMLAAAAVCWAGANLLIGSIGGFLAEGLILCTNLVTILRMVRDGRRRPET